MHVPVVVLAEVFLFAIHIMHLHCTLIELFCSFCSFVCLFWLLVSACSPTGTHMYVDQIRCTLYQVTHGCYSIVSTRYLAFCQDSNFACNQSSFGWRSVIIIIIFQPGGWPKTHTKKYYKGQSDEDYIETSSYAGSPAHVHYRICYRALRTPL